MIEFHCLSDSEQLAEAAARQVLVAAEAAITARRRFRLVLAGGQTPLATYRRLAEMSAEWGHWEVFFGDERCLPQTHPERNDQAARLNWLDRVPIPPQKIHPIPAELGAKTAAARYTDLIQGHLPFDLVLLGLGEDGHTASLFPGHPSDADALVIPVYDAPKPPPERVSLGPRALSNCQSVLMLVSGQGKRQALARLRAGEDLPIARIRPRGQLLILADAAAWG
ncbi:6-phosphogluconolactonase [Caldichromatium japonicum]|uniref:6-phosphogluconolactonase n=1 Tax=Caldichromatium japonicum TaxID=2699430 RepID=A0A6G7VB51_9GAMM|nr:6-phosphogluconolactonase [Caldichromatium japonicum]QIK37078.1 6-phosphogluconolactonase [Caldichromatium japonicum]